MRKLVSLTLIGAISLSCLSIPASIAYAEDSTTAQQPQRVTSLDYSLAKAVYPYRVTDKKVVDAVIQCKVKYTTVAVKGPYYITTSDYKKIDACVDEALPGAKYDSIKLLAVVESIYGISRQ